MAEISATTLILIAIGTSVGTGIGTPIGNFIYKKYLEPRLEKAHERIQNGKLPISLKIPEVNNEKIAEMLGRKKE